MGPDRARLRLRAGDLVEVRPAAEILATLDAQGRLDGLPFMPEMLRYCGQRLRVSARAHKTCDTVHKTGGRRMRDAVHLADLRCDGSAHGGCQAACLLYFKEAWLRRADAAVASPAPPAGAPPVDTGRLERDASREGPDGRPRYACQATELPAATEALSPYDLRQYAEDLWSGNVRWRELLWVMAVALFNALQGLRGGAGYPRLFSRATGRTPTRRLGLQPGERVRVRPREEIEPTLKDGRNRGLWFDVECVQFCGGTYRVGPRVERIIDEQTGEMLELGSDCLILEGVYCKGYYTPQRRFCPRRIYPYWREIWLERVEPPGADPVG
jgi:hypothetical protein